jgi:hypothetical protein
VTASIDRTVHIWDATSGQHLVLLSGHSDLIGSAAFSPDDSRIVTASSDQTARVWDASRGQQLLLLRGHTGQVWSAEFSPDGRHILTAGSDHTARLWDALSGAEISRFEGLSQNVSSAHFSPDGQRAVLSLDDHTARVWDLAGHHQILALSGHTEPLQFAAFASDGIRIVTASDDMTARIWDTRTPELQAQIAWAAAAQFDPLSSTQRAALGLPEPADVRAWTAAHSLCDELAGAPYDPDRLAPGVDRIEPDPAIAACARAASERSDRAHYEYGRALAAQGQGTVARGEFEQALTRGYRAAGIELARLLVQQPASQSDVGRATSLLEQAFGHGVSVAAFDLGRLYEHGVRAPAAGDATWLAADQELAWNWYRRGADLGEPNALARYGQREEEAARVASDAGERHRRRLEAFRYYASASESARRQGWPDEGWREWRLHRASLARLLALEGGMPEVAATYDALLRR